LEGERNKRGEETFVWTMKGRWSRSDRMTLKTLIEGLVMRCAVSCARLIESRIWSIAQNVPVRPTPALQWVMIGSGALALALLLVLLPLAPAPAPAPAPAAAVAVEEEADEAEAEAEAEAEVEDDAEGEAGVGVEGEAAVAAAAVQGVGGATTATGEALREAVRSER
jgi:hypothetical protein